MAGEDKPTLRVRSFWNDPADNETTERLDLLHKATGVS